MRYLQFHAQRARRRDQRGAGRKPRRGAVIVLTAFLMIVLMAIIALGLDTGYMYTMQTELDRSVDSAALAGAASLVDGMDAANQKVVEYLVRNPVGEGPVTDNDLGNAIAKFLADHGNDYQVEVGHWNATTGQLEPTTELPSAISVSMTYPNLPLFFGRVLGQSSFTVRSQAIAMYQPRDIMLVLDFSGSMNDDSELKSIGRFGLETIMDNLAQIYSELGSPQYGNMQFEPQYITVDGQPPADESQPQITVEYRYRSVYVTSSKDLSNVVLLYANGATEKFDGLTGTSGVFAGTGANAGQPIYRVWVKSGANESGEGPGYGEPFDFDPSTITSTIITALGLDGVDYPYPSGSWSNYVYYVKTSSYISNAGFAYKFGYANLINYWLEKKPCHYQTPDLWKVSAYPVTAVKDAVDVFMDYITTIKTNDRLGLVVYDASDGEAILESPLTTDLDYVADIAQHRQAGHYHRMTNIGAGLRVARQHLEANGRDGAFKMIVLMTDGCANWYHGYYDPTAARNDVISEAEIAAGLHYPIVTISLGANADLNLMQDVADITESRHFNVPGGQAVADYRDDLFAVFQDIAANRPLKLVY